MRHVGKGRQKIAETISAAVMLMASGCATSTAIHDPRNYDFAGSIGRKAELMAITSKQDGPLDLARSINRARCNDPATPHIGPRHPGVQFDNEIFSRGDTLRITVTDGEEFSKTVEVNPNGTIDLPFLEPIIADDLTHKQLEDRIARRLVSSGFFYPGFALVSVERLLTGPRRVFVSGAVFQAGVFTINERRPASVSSVNNDAFGDSAPGGTLSSALRRAGGLRPDADVKNVLVIRDGHHSLIDVSAAFEGRPMPNPILHYGDEVIVPSRGCYQEELVRASIVTAPGVRIFMSNLTQPASSNAQSVIGKDSTNFPYGTRLLQAAVSANCVGGTHVTNANRYVVYMTRDWKTGRTVVVERPIEALVRRADRDNFNPFLQEGDALACYDSAVTNARDVLKMLSDAFSPAIFVRGLLGG